MNNTGNSFDIFAEKLKGVQPSKNIFSFSYNPSLVKSNEAPVNPNIINKDNIFQQPPNLLDKLSSSPLTTEEPKSKSQSDKTYNIQETQKLSNFLNTLGFKIGEESAIQTQNTTSDKLEPLQLVARAKEGIYLVSDQEKDYLGEESKRIFEDCTVSLFNRDGTLLSVKIN